ncbi:MAG: hypothetical protein LUE86_09810 [Clostridiales bacterium]|nr:hypothetical protein [Clostridiales bacterium]
MKIRKMTGGKRAVLVLLSACLMAGGATQAFASDTINTVKVTFSVAGLDEDGIPLIEGETKSREYTINEISILEDYEVTREYDFDDEGEGNDGRDPNRLGNLGNRVYVDAGPGSASGNQGSGLASDDEDGELADDSDETFDSVYELTTTNRDEIEALIAEEYKNSGLLSYNLTCRSMGLLSGLTYVVTFDAEEGYIFSIDESLLRLNGLGATYLKHEREDSRKKLILYVRFAELDSLAWEIGKLGWSAEEVGVAEWGSSLSGSPAWYELRLDRGTIREAEGKVTGATAYDFRPYMLKEGEYSYSIRPVSDSGEKADLALLPDQRGAGGGE